MIQLRSRDGTPIGPLTPLGANGADAQIVALAGGGFAVAWSELAPKLAGEILQSLAATEDGGYLVAWTSGFSPGPVGSDGPPVHGTFVRRFRADGTPGPVVGRLDDGPTIFRNARLDRLAIVANGPDSFVAAWPRTTGVFSESIADITPRVFDAAPLK